MCQRALSVVPYAECPYAECDKLLSSKTYDYAGPPVEYMEDLDCSKILMAWPKKGQAGIQPIEAFLTEETKAALLHPENLLLLRERMPANAPRSRVRATDAKWHKIVAAAWERGMMKPVQDPEVPRDRQGHLITNGAGAVFKEKIVAGKSVAAQRFISILVPINSVTTPLQRVPRHSALHWAIDWVDVGRRRRAVPGQ